MSFPLWYILVPYAAILFFGALFVFFNVFHLLRYGIETGKTYALIALYIFSFILIVGVSALMLSAFTWNAEIAPLEFIPFIHSDKASTFGL
jgi:hypothetical protein